MISDRAMTTLRVAATLGHVLPGLGLRVRHGHEVLLEVAGAAGGPCGLRTTEPAHPGPLTISPSAFRCAVARAHERRLAGEALRFLGLGPGCEPVVELGVPAPGAARPGGIYRVPVAGRWLWATATTVAAPVAYELGIDIVDAVLPMEGIHALGIRPDPATGVSVAYAETHAGPGSEGEAAVLDLLESLLARWTAHDLVASMDHEPGVDAGRGR